MTDHRSEADLFKREALVRQQTVQDHPKEILLFSDLLNIYITGFNQVGAFTTSRENQTQWVWALMLNRSFHGFRCSVDLIQKSYYSEAIILIRRSTEDWFICGNCSIEPAVNKAIIEKSCRLPRWDELARNMKAENVYEQDYRFSSKFAHPSNESLGILLDKADSELSVAPHYDKVLFLGSCELLFRSSVRMSDILLKFLNTLSPEKAKNWWKESEREWLSITEWLKELQETTRR